MRLVAIMRSQSAGSSDSRLRFLTLVPALQTRTSIAPKAASTWSTTALTANRSAMSQGATKAESLPAGQPGAVPFELLAIAADQGHAQPHSAKVLAMLRPIPLPAPVTSAVFKSRPRHSPLGASGPFRDLTAPSRRYDRRTAGRLRGGAIRTWHRATADRPDVRRMQRRCKITVAAADTDRVRFVRSACISRRDAHAFQICTWHSLAPNHPSRRLPTRSPPDELQWSSSRRSPLSRAQRVVVAVAGRCRGGGRSSRRCRGGGRRRSVVGAVVVVDVTAGALLA